MSILVQLLKNTQAWALALLLTFTATSKAELLFSSNGTAITITGSNPKASGTLVIPATINNLPVTSISELAFYHCSGLTTVTLPSSVTSICELAFWRCTGLTTVTLPRSITSIGNWAFWGCTGLTTVTLPSSITSIGNWAFWGCTGLKSVRFMGNAPTFGTNVFHGARNVTVYYIAGKTGWDASFAGRPTALWDIPR